MTALEMQFATARLAQNIMANGGSNTDLDYACQYASVFLPKSEPYAWSNDIARAVLLASKTLPEDTVVPDIPAPAWWWFDGPLALADQSEFEVESLDLKNIVALSVGQFENGDLSIVRYRWWADKDRAAVPLPTSACRVPVGSTIAQLRAELMEYVSDSISVAAVNRTVEMVRFFVAARAWVDQRILVWSSGHVERHRRKQIYREYKADVSAGVKIVHLRRADNQSDPTSSYQRESYDWSCRWIVGGHWRNQPYKDDRKLIYIMPYVKGPDDKPLRVPTHTVYQVSR